MSAASNADELAEIIRKCLNEGGEGQKRLASALTKACIGVEESAKRRVPTKTHHLQQSITHQVEDGPLTGHVFSNVEYAPYVEIGTGIRSSRGDGRKEVPWPYEDPATGELIWTKGSHPHPYLKPAVENNISAILKCFEGIF